MLFQVKYCLSNHFKLISGISPYEYPMIRRVEPAVRMLGDTPLSVTETARKSGFTNLADFNRAFMRITGMTPREYRQSKRETDFVSLPVRHTA